MIFPGPQNYYRFALTSINSGNNNIRMPKSKVLSKDILENDLDKLFNRIQSKEKEIPLLNDLEELIKESIHSNNGWGKNEVKKIEYELRNYSKLLENIKKQNLFKKSIKTPKILEENIKIEYLTLKVEKLNYLCKETFYYCNQLDQLTQQNELDPRLLLTELVIVLSKIENEKANPDLNQDVSKFRYAMTMAARTSSDDFNPLMEEGSQPQDLNGLFAGLASGVINVFGLSISRTLSNFKHMTYKIDKIILSMKEILFCKATRNVELKNQYQVFLKNRINKIYNQHRDLSFIPSYLRGDTETLKTNRVLLSEISENNESDDHNITFFVANVKPKPIVLVMQNVVGKLLEVEKYLYEFSKNGTNNLGLPICNLISDMLNTVKKDEDTVLLCEHLWNELNKKKYYYHSMSGIRQIYKSPLNAVMEEIKYNPIAKTIIVNLLNNLEKAKSYLTNNYQTLYVAYSRLLNNTIKSDIIENMFLIRLTLENNAVLSNSEKQYLYKILFANRFNRDHGNLFKTANSRRKDNYSRVFITSFIRYGGHNPSLTQIGSNNLDTQILRWNNFQDTATIGRSNAINNTADRSHTLNTAYNLHQENLKYFRTIGFEKVFSHDISYKDIEFF